MLKCDWQGIAVTYTASVAQALIHTILLYLAPLYQVCVIIKIKPFPLLHFYDLW